MKRTIFTLLIILVLISLLAACDGTIGKTQLATPENVYLDGKVVYWNAVEGANRYLITVETDKGGYSFTQNETSYEIPIEIAGSYRIFVIARDIDGKYLDSDPSQSVEYIMGLGTKDDPIRVYSVTELEEIGIGATVVSGETIPYYYVLEKNIDLQGQEWKPIGVGQNRFQGHFDGQGYTISNFKITKDDGGYFGLFSGVNNGSIRNLNVRDFNINLSIFGTYRIGGLAGYIDNNSVIENCHVEGDINYKSSLSNTQKKSIGLLVGESKASKVVNCSSKGNMEIEANRIDVGGLIGYNNSSSIKGSNSNTDIRVKCGSNTTNYIAGFVGYNYSGASIEHSYSNGSIYSQGYNMHVGGFVGANMYSNARISNSFSRVEVETVGTNISNVGSFIGQFANSAIIEYCYATGRVEAATSSTYRVGFIGYATGTLIRRDCYFDYESVGVNRARGNENSYDLSGIFSRTTEQMMNQENYIDFDFESIWDIDADANDGYPILREYIPPVEEEEED